MSHHLQSQQKPLDINDIQYRHTKTIANHLINAFYLIRSFNKTCKSVYFSQTFIGEKLKLSPNRACEIVNMLQDDGFIIIHGRQSKTCEYEISPYYLQEEQEFKLNRFRKQFIAFSVFLLASITAGSSASRQLDTQGFNLFNCTSTTLPKSTSTNEESTLYLHDPTWYYQACTCTGCTREAVPNRKLSSLEFEALLESTNMAQILLPFTEEQLEILEAYPKNALDYANRLVAKDLLDGKTIHNQFNYFVALCKGYTQKNPEREGRQKTIPVSVVEQRQQSQNQRYQDFLDRRQETRRIKIAALGYEYDSLTGTQQNALLRGEKI